MVLVKNVSLQSFLSFGFLGIHCHITKKDFSYLAVVLVIEVKVVMVDFPAVEKVVIAVVVGDPIVGFKDIVVTAVDVEVAVVAVFVAVEEVVV